MDRQARKLASHREDGSEVGSEVGSNTDSDSEEKVCVPYILCYLSCAFLKMFYFVLRGFAAGILCILIWELDCS